MFKKVVIAMIVVIGCISYVSAAAWNLPGVKIISRAEWGANEAWRYSTTSKTERDILREQASEDEPISQTISQGQIATNYLLEVTPTEQSVEAYREMSNGNYLKWPESIHENKNKIIIHHTAGDYTDLLTGGTGAQIQQLQDIYKYHALTNGRGDIGYNFVIDPFGNIYEGRAGGEGVVGAHVSWNNTPTVGISLMGNFNVNVPTDVSLKALVNLTTALSRKYKIDPQSTVAYFKKSSEYPFLKEYTNYAIAGHTDAGVTSCPGTNLYNLLPEIRDQVSENLSKTSLANLPIVAQKKSVVDRGIMLSDWYYADTTTITLSLPVRWAGVTSCVTSDTSVLVHSCSSSNGRLSITLEKAGISGIKTFSVTSDEGTKKLSFMLIWNNDFSNIANTKKQAYMNRKGISASSTSINKITSKLYLSDIQTALQTPLNVLLYELSMNYPRHEVSCDGGCVIQADDETYTGASAIVELSNGFVYLSLPTMEQPLLVGLLEISSATNGLVRVNNYLRKSYGGTPRNTFRGSLIWKKDTIKNLSSGNFVEQAIVTNKTSFDNYMKGIAETSDSDTIVKQKIILLLAKMYTLFYINGENVHPSIPAGVSYQAIDNPDMFQKYVGAGWESTSTVSPRLLATIEDDVILYNGYVPILPYFSCSAGFTRSAKDKRGRSDTPYLQSKLDFGACFDFSGHGVGLSGKGAQFLAEKGWTVEQILQYYYPGVEVKRM